MDQNPPKLLTAFRNQLSLCWEIAKAENLDEGLKGPPSAALAFAEELSLCPTVDAARAKMQRGPESARSFLQVAMIVDGLLSTPGSARRDIDLTNKTPFFVLASAVQEYLSKMRRQQPKLWS
jgi:hypothetical protein